MSGIIKYQRENHFRALLGRGGVVVWCRLPTEKAGNSQACAPPEFFSKERVLRMGLAKIYVRLQNPDFNFTVRSGPAETAGSRHFHWYVSVIARLTPTAGFELGSGRFIHSLLPEAAEFFAETGWSRRWWGLLVPGTQYLAN